MLAALFVGLILATLWFLEKMLGTPMVIRPIVVSPLVGLALGDLKSGVIIGASLELIFMGAIQIGGSIPPDVLVGSGLGTAFAILSKQGPEIAVVLALPIAILAQSIKALIFIIRSGLMNTAVKLASNADIAGMKRLNIFGLLLQCAMYFAVAFIAVLLGADVVARFVQTIPPTIMSALTNIGKLLPAVGFALLLIPMMNGKNFLYFILGFILMAFLKLPVIAITLLGIVLAFVVVFEKNNENGHKPEKTTVDKENSQDSNWEAMFDGQK
ncbi:MAG: PTS sugar transporter subunit IIC [Anaerolineaceae bacterium]|nr:PTS sugar transporter subunit IIC [Anaerolineaceae bacterium]